MSLLYKASIRFYVLALLISIPTHLIMASGSRPVFAFEYKDLVFVFFVILTLALLLIYLKNWVTGSNIKIVSVALGCLLCLSLWQGIAALRFMINWKFPENALIVVILLSHIIPSLFILTNTLLLYGLTQNRLRKQAPEHAEKIPRPL
jgi:hypothetical protein